MHDLVDQLKCSFNFEKKEFYDLILISLSFGFMVSFREWGIESISVSAGLFSWFISALIIFLVTGLYFSIIKCMAIWKGYTMNFEKNWFVVLVALFLTFLSNGFFVMLIPASIYYKPVKKYRLGKGRAGVEFTIVGYIGVVTALVMVLLIALFIPFNDFIFQRVADIAFLLAIFTMLPVPYNTGFYLFTESYFNFLSLSAIVLVSAFLVYLELSLLVSLVIALVVGIIAWVLTYKYLE